MSKSFASLASNLANCLLETDRLGEAEELYEECYQLRSQFMPEKWDCYRVQALAGVAKARQQKWEAAESWLRDGLAGMKRTMSGSNPLHLTSQQLVEVEVQKLESRQL